MRSSKLKFIGSGKQKQVQEDSSFDGETEGEKWKYIGLFHAVVRSIHIMTVNNVWINIDSGELNFLLQPGFLRKVPVLRERKIRRKKSKVPCSVGWGNTSKKRSYIQWKNVMRQRTVNYKRLQEPNSTLCHMMLMPKCFRRRYEVHVYKK